MGEHWHSENLNFLLDQLGVEIESGLSNKEVEKRLEKYGSNELERAKKRHPIFLFFEQFKDPLVIILLVALLISIIIGLISDEHQRLEYFIDALAITAIVLFNAFFGFIQEYKAEKSIEALKSMAPSFTTVIRDGNKQRIEARLLVPGDIILLEEGDKIPADGRLLESLALRVDESALTGESFPTKKEATSQAQPYAAIADRDNSVFSGTNVTKGRGQAVVVQTGMRTEFGKIAKGLLAEETGITPLQKRLATLGKWIGIASLTICAGIFAIGVLLKREAIEMFIVAVGLAVAAVPEGLPAVVTLALALGVQRMSRENAIIRRLPSVETLGSTTIICSDKTGTLTRNKMTVRKILTVDEEFVIFRNTPMNDTIRHILTIGLECNNAQLAQSKRGGSKEIDIGDPTEIALLRVAKRMNVTAEYERLYEIPFDSDSKRMSVVVKNSKGEHFVFTKGAPDVLIDLCCSHYFSMGEIKPLDDEMRMKLEKAEQKLAKTGYRMLGMAMKSIDSNIDKILLSEDTEEIEASLIYIGAMAIMDPPRKGTKASIETCKNAGIRPVMITGDHLKTAIAVSTEIGLVSSPDTTRHMEGFELAQMTDEEFASVVMDVSVFARVSPEHKLKIVTALKSHNQIVAMTGDGVNDAPALKRADIGVAMGIAGTDVSKEASDMILADDDFSTIVGAVLEGRTIYDNMRKFILYLLSCNAGEIAVMFFGILLTSLLFKTPILPLLAIQILWVNLVTDGLPALAMGVDPPDPDVMTRHPRDPSEPILTRKSILFIIYSAVIIAAGTLLLFFLYISTDLIAGQLPSEDIQTRARTVAFTMLIMFQMIMALNIRKEEHSLLGEEFFRNPYLLLAIASSLILHILIVYIPFFQPFFDTTALQLSDWAVIISIGSILVIIDEIRTFVAHRVPRLRKIAGYW